MNKFKIGDRVRVSHAYRGDKEIELRIGDTGTVLDDDTEPYVRMDRYNKNLGSCGGMCENGYGYCFEEDELELIGETKKAIFNIEKYQGRCAMRCETEEQANEFCKYLHSVGRKWFDGSSYLEDNKYKEFKEDTCYCFNEGGYEEVTSAITYNYRIFDFKHFSLETKECSKMTKKELVQFLLENYVDENNKLDLSHLNFGDFCGDIDISNMFVKGSLHQNNQQVVENIYQYGQVYDGILYNHRPKDTEIELDYNEQEGYSRLQKLKPITIEELNEKGFYITD